MERLVVLDTETTGLEPDAGHRIVEIGCTELVNLGKKKTRQWLINPEREIPQEATRIHGITNEKVADCPVFKDIADDFLVFIGADPLVIHNAAFDLGFLNAELTRVDKPVLDASRAIDTLVIARRRFPNASASLDALCRRFRIDLSQRVTHGALLDTDLLADVYVELMGGGQFSLALGMDATDRTPAPGVAVERPLPVLEIKRRSWPLSAKEATEHQNYLEFLKKKANVVRWPEAL
ncbi:MAG: DNA polymerase III, epsilon subunit [Magnetococcales bacterium]|nr:DNA polymerase III, epsilon subunit [Magnetococcales bacterium]HIJ86019.1 DNA polymerase III subunit epsilon [Magnetococcales bacterium]